MVLTAPVAITTWRTVLTPETEARFMEVEGGSVKTASLLQSLMGLNILSASKYDLSGKVYSNVDLGLTLAARGLDTMPWLNEASGGDGEVRWPLGKGFLDAYIAWATVVSMESNMLSHVSDLLIPSIVCTAEESPTMKRLWEALAAADDL